MLGGRIKRLILLRLLFGTLLLYAPSVSENNPEWVFYGISGLICLLSVFYVLWYVSRRGLRILAMTQIGIDVAIESILVYATGGMESLFTTFYVLSILSAALVLGERRVVFQTTLGSSAAFLLMSLFSRPWEVVPENVTDPVYFLYGMVVRIVIFATVGCLGLRLAGSVAELQRRLKLSERLSLLGEAASKIAHEVRNPLGSIQTASEVLQDTLAGRLDTTQTKMLSLIHSEANRLSRTLQRILNYAKQTSPAPRLLQLDALVDRTVQLVQLRAKDQNGSVEVQKRYEPPRPRVYADEEQFLSALLNLVLNAYQAMPSGGKLMIAAKEELKGTQISVEDSGGGIPPEQVKDLFQPFKSKRKGGTGLGLAEVHKIIAMHEGDIKVESQPGKGTAFHLFFPKP